MARRQPAWHPRRQDYVQVFVEQNPWQSGKGVPEMLAFRAERPLAGSLWKRLMMDEPRRFQVVVGSRRVGKTTCLYQTVRRLLKEGVPPKRLWWLRLDHPLLMQVPLDTLVRTAMDASNASGDRPVFLFLDELTYARDWDGWLKTFYDERWPIRLAASSSSTAVLRDKRVESGVGRWDEQYLAPYLFGEFLDLVEQRQDIPVASALPETLEACVAEKPDTGALADWRKVYLLTGGFPELLVALGDSSQEHRDLLLRSQRTLRSDAIERTVYKDIPQAFGVEDPMVLERMLYTLAGQVTGILSPRDLCRSLGFTQPTFDRYLTYLVHAFLVFALPNYAGSEGAKQRRGRKLYFVDGAIRNAALQRGLAPLDNPAEMGLLLENLVAAHLHALGQQTQVRLYHWRHRGVEVDLIYDQPDRPLAFEVAGSASHTREGLHCLLDRFPRFKGGCYVVAPDALPAAPGDHGDEIGTLPLDLLLLAASAQAQRELRLRLTGRGEGC